jgi:hypothetical protein
MTLQSFPYNYFTLSILRANKKDPELSHNELILKGNPIRQSVDAKERCQEWVFYHAQK